jgi:hypothetical protein
VADKKGRWSRSTPTLQRKPARGRTSELRNTEASGRIMGAQTLSITRMTAVGTAQIGLLRRPEAQVSTHKKMTTLVVQTSCRWFLAKSKKAFLSAFKKAACGKITLQPS